MADTKVSGLTALALASIAPDDLFYIVDVSAGAAGSKKSKVADLFGDGTNRTLLTDASGNVIVRQPAGVAGTDELQIVHDGQIACFDNKDALGRFHFRRQGTDYFTIKPDANRFESLVGEFNIATAGGIILVNNDVGIKRDAAKVFRLTDSANPCWLQQSAGRSRNTADVTNATTTFANLADLTHTLIAGRKYSGRMVVKCSDSTPADGVKIDFNGGTASMTSFAAAAAIRTGGAATPVNQVSSALATVINWSTITGETWILIDITLVCNAGGTFIPRQAQNAHTTGTLTVNLGTFLWLEDSPN